MKKMLLVLTVMIILALTGCAAPSSQQDITQNKSNNGNADVVFVEATENTDGRWTFSVTVSHPDTGWEDYADGWDIVLPDGTVIKPSNSAQFTRTLTHPHVDEQPFTRSQSGIIIPEGVSKVRVRAHDIVDGYGGQEITLDLNTAEGDGYRVERTS